MQKGFPLLAFAAMFVASNVAVAQVSHGSAVQPAKDAVSQMLLDPSSAQFRKIEVSPTGAVCGEVNAKNQFGGYVGFNYFAVDASLNIVNVHNRNRPIKESMTSMLMLIEAVCDRRKGESLHQAQIRIMRHKLETILPDARDDWREAMMEYVQDR